MGEWFAAKALVGLPELPTTERSIQRMAKREGWQCQKRQGRGGGWEYHVSALPEETRVALGWGPTPSLSSEGGNASTQQASDRDLHHASVATARSVSSLASP
ncbi:MAG: DNA-binding protein [Cyanobacteria bacterium P01_C01_bin.120]